MDVDMEKLTDEQPGMLAFMSKNSDQSYMSEIYRDWTEMLKCMEMDKDIRQDKQMDKWFQQCFLSRGDLEMLEDELAPTIAERRREKLYIEFMELMEHKINDFTGFMKLQWQDAKKKMMELDNGGSWVDLAIRCVEKEHTLISKYTQRVKEEDNVRVRVKVEKDFDEIRDQKKALSKLLQKLEGATTCYNQLQEQKDEKSQLLEGCNRVQQINRNGNVQASVWTRNLTNEMASLDFEIGKQYNVISHHVQNAKDMFDSILVKLTDVATELVQKVVDWQRQFQLQYAELAANPDLDKIAAWCAEAGKLINDLLKEQYVEFSKYVEDIVSKELHNQLFNLQYEFFQRTFVVTEQDHYIVKVDKKHLPKITVRILGATHNPALVGSEVKAFLIYENDLNDCWHDNNLDLGSLEEGYNKHFKDKTNKVRFAKSKDRSVVEGCFQSLQIDGKKFERPNSGKQVHEEKYRIVFATQLNLGNTPLTFWTLSLPVVVTTGANQGCLSQASIMWECFSINVHDFPIISTDELPLPWTQVCEMLDYKIKKLCPARGLTEENKRHLKRRLLGDADKPDDTPVKLKAFCFDKMERTSFDEEAENHTLPFSFWKWFIGNYNLIEKYLLPYWQDGLIHGFLSTEDATDMLNAQKARDGMFILRFSDHNIIDSQGIKSVFGHLTACVMTVKTDPGGRKKKKIYPKMDVAGHKTLWEKNLAKILNGTMDKHNSPVYKCLYPGDQTRERTFDKYVNSDQVVKGYTGSRIQWVVDLEQQLCAIEMYTGKQERSPSLDSGIDTSSPAPGTSNGKRYKRGRSGGSSEKHPTLSKLLQPRPSPGPVSPGQMSDFSNISSPMSSPFYQAQSDFTPLGSPAQLPNQHCLVDKMNQSTNMNPSQFVMNHAPLVCSPDFQPIPTTVTNSGDNLEIHIEDNSSQANVSGQVEIFVTDGNMVTCQTSANQNRGSGHQTCGDLQTLCKLFQQLAPSKRSEFMQTIQGLKFNNFSVPQAVPPLSDSGNFGLNSGCSLPDLSLNEMEEAQEMNSGTIDPNVFDKL